MALQVTAAAFWLGAAARRAAILLCVASAVFLALAYMHFHPALAARMPTEALLQRLPQIGALENVGSRPEIASRSRTLIVMAYVPGVLLGALFLAINAQRRPTKAPAAIRFVVMLMLAAFVAGMHWVTYWVGLFPSRFRISLDQVIYALLVPFLNGFLVAILALALWDALGFVAAKTDEA
jgi:NO-binding membrane sensor protein with MHYT domain